MKKSIKSKNAFYVILILKNSQNFSKKLRQNVIKFYSTLKIVVWLHVLVLFDNNFSNSLNSAKFASCIISKHFLLIGKKFIKNSLSWCILIRIRCSKELFQGNTDKYENSIQPEVNCYCS